MKPIALLTVSEATTAMGAHSRHKELMAGLARRDDIEAVWIGADPGLEGVRVVAVDPVSSSWLRRNLIRRRMSALLAREMQSMRNRSRVVVTFSETGLVMALMSRSGDAATRFIHFQRADLLEKHEFLRRNEASLWRRVRLRLVDRAIRRAYRSAARNGFGFVVQSRNHADRLRRLVGASASIEVLPNNCNASFMQGGDDAETSQPEHKRLLLVANLYARGKGLDLAIETMDVLVGDYHLTVIGDGPDLEALRAATATRCDIEFAGRVPGAAALMPSYDCLLVPTRIDDYPNVVLEGLARRVPIVATDIPAHREILGPDHPLTGLDAQSLARELRRLENPGWRRELLAIQEQRRQVHSFDWVARAAGLIGLESAA